ncbi:hypothetical protein DJ568_03030 [Mucilaginibacter hurinus]|uniref:Uncharacterized protein n=1 Tax=Mucilaginibacter hurinus TaxID=2201324 RepID=A0A367GTU9_9SPHI|nr:hypothetical protein [Mucilaginibacter hurinus]RCH56844.1 hypothetical protein DJ568_03030 [Mucilaginibacter hurinus]
MKLAENIEIDFEHELNFSAFPFKEVIKADPHFKNILKAEYLQAPLCPKPHLFLREYISDKEWAKDSAERLPRTQSNERHSQPFAAPFVADTPLETKSKRLTEEFFDKALANTLDKKYYGHRISETKLANNLKQLSDQLDVFKQYVIDNPDITTYRDYAQAAAKSLMKQLDKIIDLKLRAAILNELIMADLQTEITVLIVVKKVSETELNAIKKRFIILKAYADEILYEAKDQIALPATDDSTPAEQTTIPINLVDRTHGYYNWPDRFFSYDLNNYQFSKSSEPANVKEQFRLRQIVLETKFLHAFKAANADDLKSLLEEQFELTPANKSDFLDYVEIIGNANLKSSFQGSSIRKADIFRVWLKAKREVLGASSRAAVRELTGKKSLFLDLSKTSIFIDVLKRVEPPILNNEGTYRLGERSKSAVVAWFDILDRGGNIDSSLTADQKTTLLNQLIPNLNMDKRSLGNTHKRASRSYYPKLEALIKDL